MSENVNAQLLETAKSGNLSDIARIVESHQYRVNLDISDEYGSTILMYVAQRGKLERVLETVRFLVTHGAKNINARNRDGRTCLMYAAINANPDAPEIVRCFLSLNPNVDICDEWGMTALMHASANCYPHAPEIVQNLVEYSSQKSWGCERIGKRDENGWNSVMQAVSNVEGRPSPCIIRYLVEYVRKHSDESHVRAVIDTPDIFGWTALMRTVNGIVPQSLETARYLVACGANVNARNDSGGTVLTVALGNNVFRHLRDADGESVQRKMVRMLLDTGRLDVNAIDGEGWSMLDCAKYTDDATIIDMIADAMQKQNNTETAPERV